MLKFSIFLFVYMLDLIDAYQINGLAPLTSEQVKRLEEWKPNNKQSMWELSGQFEGDIVFDKNSPRNGVISTKYRWPNKELPYELDSIFNASEKILIQEALDFYNKRTCITLRPRTSSDKDYVYVTGEKTGCWSYVGRSGNRQQLNLQRGSPGCLVIGTIQHEFLHALGFYHQQSAPNRDKYIWIIWNNIEKGAESNFQKKTIFQATDFGVAYDYGSVMHYGAYAFSKNGRKTIQTKDPYATIGQRMGLSAKDVEKLHKMYNCS